MNKKTPVEMERARITKITRTLTRLKYSLMADDEVNEILPDRLAQFDRDVHNGTLKFTDVPLLEEVLNGSTK